LIRTAECAGAHGVVIPKHHSATITQTVVKTSAGASLLIPITKVTNLTRTLEELKGQGLWIVGADMRGDRAYDDFDYSGALALVVGSEGRGIRRLVKEKCDFVVKIPLFGKIESLNASVAGAIMMYEVARTRHKRQQER
jgi:23S rRNA (guanosine2251-2'-O)-methyltransferase